VGDEGLSRLVGEAAGSASRDRAAIPGFASDEVAGRGVEVFFDKVSLTTG